MESPTETVPSWQLETLEQYSPQQMQHLGLLGLDLAEETNDQKIYGKLFQACQEAADEWRSLMC